MKPVIVFYADTHTYWNSEKRLPSVSKFYRKYLPEFERDYWLTYKALKNIIPDEFKAIKTEMFGKAMRPGTDLFKVLFDKLTEDQTRLFFYEKECLAENWLFKSSQATYYGTLFHEQQERLDYERGGKENPFDGKFYEIPEIAKKKERWGDNYTIVTDLADLPDGYYPELLIFDLDLGVAGQVDMAWIVTKRKYRYYFSNDYKTGKKPDKWSMDTCLEPISHLRASKHTGYSLQSSSYAYMMERAGFKVGDLAYTHVQDYDSDKMEIVDVKYLKDELDTMISYTKYHN